MENTEKVARVLHTWKPTIGIVKRMEGTAGNGGYVMLLVFQLLDNGTVYFEFLCSDKELKSNTINVDDFTKYWDIDMRELLNHVQ